SNRRAPPLSCLGHSHDWRIRVEPVKGSTIDLDAHRLSLLLSRIGQALAGRRRRPVVQLPGEDQRRRSGMIVGNPCSGSALGIEGDPGGEAVLSVRGLPSSVEFGKALALRSEIRRAGGSIAPRRNYRTRFLARASASATLKQ